MFSVLARVILIVSGAVAEIFVASDAVNYPVIQGVVAVLLGAMIVFAAAFWPRSWSEFLDRAGRKAGK